MDREILELFKNIYDKQSELSILTDKELFTDYSNSELHTIEMIGSLEEVNGVMISSELNLTRGAVSKIVSKLIKKGLVESYQNEDNRKEIYYKLRDDGLEVYKAHEEAHKDWEERELKFFKDIDCDEKRIVGGFLEKYDEYLNKLVEERS